MNETTKRKDTFNWQHDKEKKKQFLKDNLLKLTDEEMAIEINKRWPEDGRATKGSVVKQRPRWGLLKPLGGIQKNSSIISESLGIVLEETQKQVLEWLKKESLSVGEISRRLDRSKETVIKILDNLRKDGYEVSLEEETRQVVLEREIKREFHSIELEPLYRKVCKIMLISDTHLNSKEQQLTLLHTAYATAEKEKVHYAIHNGDLGEGQGLYRGQEEEIFNFGADNQADYIIDVYPRTKAFKTYIIPGSHDWIWMKKFGYNIVKKVCREREDLVYTPGERSFSLRGLTFETLHPSGGMPYSRGYRLQKLIEGAIGDFITRIRAKQLLPENIPQFYCAGHLHTALWMSYLGFHAYMVPCFQSQTTYLRDKGHHPQVGFYIINVYYDDDGNVNKIKHDYYDYTSQIKKNDY